VLTSVGDGRRWPDFEVNAGGGARAARSPAGSGGGVAALRRGGRALGHAGHAQVLRDAARGGLGAHAKGSAAVACRVHHGHRCARGQMGSSGHAAGPRVWSAGRVGPTGSARLEG
jgi:hypothetical protein